jgi:hypothetical protein
MAPELFSEEIKPRQFPPTPAKVVLPFRRQIRNPSREVYEKLSAKLDGRDLPRIEYAKKYLSHLLCYPAKHISEPSANRNREDRGQGHLTQPRLPSARHAEVLRD